MEGEGKNIDGRRRKNGSRREEGECERERKIVDRKGAKQESEYNLYNGKMRDEKQKRKRI